MSEDDLINLTGKIDELDLKDNKDVQFESDKPETQFN